MTTPWKMYNRFFVAVIALHCKQTHFGSRCRKSATPSNHTHMCPKFAPGCNAVCMWGPFRFKASACAANWLSQKAAFSDTSSTMGGFFSTSFFEQRGKHLGALANTPVPQAQCLFPNSPIHPCSQFGLCLSVVASNIPKTMQHNNQNKYGHDSTTPTT